ncbi:MAG: hypothetical protein AB8B58_07825 [Roseobacter sp.]
MKTHDTARANTCLGCRECSGVCFALVELAGVPDAILSQPAKR